MRLKMKGKRWILLVVPIPLILLAVFGVLVAWSDKLESGYVAFNAREYKEARDQLRLIANLGDHHAQQLMSYMSGLGLGQPVDFGEALRWMQKGAGSDGKQNSVGEQAYYLGASAVDGLYGDDRKELGLLWLKMSYYSGVQKAREKIAKIPQPA